MNRSRWMTVEAMRIVGVVLGSVCSGPLALAAERPNIVLVLFDDLGYGQPPSYRAESALKTPNFDRLAQEGMRFTDAHSAAAVCTPTRYGLLTGRYPFRIGQFGVLTTYSKPIILPPRLTLASLLKGHGYHTACIGKWHLGLNWVDGRPGSERQVPVGAQLKDGPGTVGFDYFCGFTHARNIGTIIERVRVVANVDAAENQPLLIEKAVRYIGERARSRQPFFLYFPMCPPHTPIVPATEFIGQSGAEDVVGLDAKYGDWLFQGDAMLGQLLAALHDHGLSDNTLVIVTSDNGAERREYPPLRGSKRSIYEGGHRVPFVARWPGKVKAGTVNDQIVCLNDMLATVAQIVGTELPEDAGEDSVSLLPHLLAGVHGPVRETIVHQSMSGDLAIRKGAWKLIFFKDGKRELYNLESDLGEANDVSASNPGAVQRLTSLMHDFVENGRSTPGAPQRSNREIRLPFGTRD